MMLVVSLVEIGPVVLEKKKLNVGNVFSQFCFYLLSERGVSFPLNKLESPLP